MNHVMCDFPFFWVCSLTKTRSWWEEIMFFGGIVRPWAMRVLIGIENSYLAVKSRIVEVEFLWLHILESESRIHRYRKLFCAI